jgi:ADP-ribose pyrophosphatase YjhB (NUDIX family)
MQTKNLPLLNARLLFEKIDKAISRWPKGSPKGGQFAPSGAGSAASGDLFAPPAHSSSSSGPHGVLPRGAAFHAQKDDHGNSVVVHAPTPASAPSTWTHAGKTATFVPGGSAPATLNGTKLEPWHDAPTDHAGWRKVEGTNPALEHDAPFLPHPQKYTAAGVVIEEPDGRVWLTKPTNHYGGYQHTFPKGTAEPGLTLQQNAIKEAYEETGLKVQITGVLGDYDRDTSRARVFTAKRVGGTPTAMGWESQAMRLVPREQLHDYLNKHVDKGIASDYQWETPHPAGKVKKNAKQPRWPKGSPLGGQWKSAGSDGFTAPPKIGSATNPTYQKIADGMHKAAQAGDWKHVQEATAKLDAKVAGHASKGKLNSHDKWAAQAHQYGKELLAEKEHKTKAVASVHAITGPEKLSTWTKVGAKPGGSSDGAIYKDQHGQKWLVKSYGDDDMAKSEVLASHLLHATGAGAAEMKLVDLGGAHKGGLGVASKMLEGHEALNAGNLMHKMAAQKDFAAHAWLANWDAIGLSHDNTVMHGGKAVNIDPGGALDYKAMGGKKGALFGTTVGELDTMRDASINPSAKSIYGPMTHSDMVKSAEGVLALPPETIKKLVDTYGPGDATHKAALTAKLLARQQDLASKLGAAPAHKTPHLDSAPVSAHHTPDIAAHAPVKPHINGVAYASVADEIEAAHKAGNKAAVEQALAGVPDNTLKGKKVHAYGAEVLAHLAANGGKPAAKPMPAVPDVSKETWGHTIGDAQAHHANDAPEGLKHLHTTMGGMKSPASQKVKAYVSALHEHLTGKALEAPAPAAEPAKPLRAPKAAEAHVAVATAHAAQAATPIALPAKPTKLSSAANPNHGLIKKVDAMHAHAEAFAAGSIPKDVALAAIASHTFGSNTFGKTAAKHQANLIAAIASSTKEHVAEQAKAHADAVQAHAAAAKPAKKEPKFDPAKLSTPPNFMSWGATGKPGPSSKQAINEANAYAVGQIHEAAKTGKPEAIDAVKLPVVADAAGTVKHVSPSEHPSQHVKGFAQQMKNEIDAQLNPPKKFRLAEGHPLHALDAMFPAHKGATSGAGVKNVAKYIELGAPGALHKPLDLPKITFKGKKLTTSTYAKTAQTGFAKLGATQQQAVQSYTGSGYHEMNSSLWKGAPNEQAKAANSAIHTIGHEIAPGTILSRKISISGSDLEQVLASTGKVIQEPAIMSTSISPDVWSGNVHLKMTVGPGVKGLYVGQGSNPTGGSISHFSNEKEILLPANTRLHVQKVETNHGTPDADGFGNGLSHIVHVIVLPTHASDKE